MANITLEIARLEGLVATVEQKNDRADDATWILTSSFMILTMQTGFGFMEVMMRNAFHLHSF